MGERDRFFRCELQINPFPEKRPDLYRENSDVTGEKETNENNEEANIATFDSSLPETVTATTGMTGSLFGDSTGGLESETTSSDGSSSEGSESEESSSGDSDSEMSSDE